MGYQITDLRLNLVKAIEESADDPVRIWKYKQTIAALISNDQILYFQRMANYYYIDIFKDGNKADKWESHSCGAQIVEGLNISNHEEQITAYVKRVLDSKKTIDSLKVDFPAGKNRSKNFRTFVLLFSFQKGVFKIYGFIDK